MRVLALFLSLAAARPSLACSAFLLDTPTGPVVGKSYDWNDERGLVIVNKRGVHKRALVLSAGDKPAAWNSRYASLTFNQYGRELPNGGINEAGLVVEVLLLPASELPSPDGRPVVTELGFVQYLLDQAETAGEALELATAVRIVTAYAKIHYFLCDASGACAVLELLGGKLVVTSGEAMPVRAITNSTYAESAAALPRAPAIAALGSRSTGSTDRFVKLSRQIATPASGDAVAAAFAILDTVRFPRSTQWNIVYDLRQRRVHFRSRTHPAVKVVALGDFPATCAEPVMTLDLLTDRPGEARTRFVPYREETNLVLVTGTLAPLRAKLPAGIERRVATYPSTLACAP
jgi:penicillin V acylase-like amidase (Ntn superfamily)